MHGVFGPVFEAAQPGMLSGMATVDVDGSPGQQSGPVQARSEDRTYRNAK